MNKDFMLRARFDVADKARLERLAEHFALSHAAVIRFLLKRECDGLDVKQPPKKKPKKK
jgi:hypothetical protein